MAQSEQSADLSEPTPLPPYVPPKDPETITYLSPLLLNQGLTLDLVNPHLARETAPEKFQAKWSTTKGEFVVEFVRAWAPHGVDRIYNLIKIEFYKDVLVHRAIEGVLVQFGIHGETSIATTWREAMIQDDIPKQSNRRGYMSFAKMNRRPHSRSTQLFINLRDNPVFDQQHFAPLGRVISGLRVVDSFFSGYGDNVPARLIRNEGNEGVSGPYPKLERILKVTLVDPADEAQ